VPETGEEGDRREMYERDVGKRRKTDRTYLPGDHYYSALGGVLVLSHSIRTN